MMAAAEAAAPVVNTGKHILQFFCQNLPPQTLLKSLTGLARWFLYWLVRFDDFFWIGNTVKLDFKELLIKEQIDVKELFTDYQLFYTINLLLNKELLLI